MKKIMNLLLTATLLFSFTACAADNEKSSEMYLQKAELTTEEQSILELAGAGNNPYILDFKVDDTVQSLQINAYELKDGKWEWCTGGGGEAYTKPEGRIALTFDNIGMGFRTAVEHNGSTSYDTECDFDFEGLSRAVSYVTDKTEIVYEKEIPLVIEIYTSQNHVETLMPEYGFYEPERYVEAGHEKVYAITCIFSQRTVSELSEER